YGTVFPGESGLTGVFTVILSDWAGSPTSVDYNVVLTDPVSGLNLKDKLTVIKDPSETDSETDGSIIPPADYQAQGNVSTGDTSDKWIVTFNDAPDATGDYAAIIRICTPIEDLCS
ncbi:MAG: hypothetical protein AAB037_03450, partial [Chloroflexota bacterium]